MNDEIKKVCDALIGLIGKVCTDCNTVPDGFNLSFGNDKIKITADINLDYDVSDEILKEFMKKSGSSEIVEEFMKKSGSSEIVEEFIKKSGSSEIVEEFINRIWKNDEKE